MRSTATLKAAVQGGRVIVQDRVDLPDGTELQLEVTGGEDELDEEELARLDEAIERWKADIAAGRIISAEALLASFAPLDDRQTHSVYRDAHSSRRRGPRFVKR